jgi:hypothetical protein
MVSSQGLFSTRTACLRMLRTVPRPRRRCLDPHQLHIAIRIFSGHAGCCGVLGHAASHQHVPFTGWKETLTRPHHLGVTRFSPIELPYVLPTVCRRFADIGLTLISRKSRPLTTFLMPQSTYALCCADAALTGR